MLQPLMTTNLLTKRIILASSSPRRKQLLQGAGLRNFEILVSDFEELVDKSQVLDPIAYVKKMALGKASDVWSKVAYCGPAPDLVIGSDTIVYLDGQIFEKPRNTEHAFQMLSSLSNRTHTVFTGVTMLFKDASVDCGYEERTFHEATEVTMGDLPSSVINAYVETGEPLDKAGGYGIQGTQCSSLIHKVNGNFDNVVGFPVHSFCLQMYDYYGRPE